MLSTITPTPAQWDAFVSAQPRAHVLQLSAWGDLKSAYEWQAERVAVLDGETIQAGAQLLFRALPLRLGTLAYLAMGPYQAFDAGSNSALQTSLWNAIHACARRYHAVFLKWEPGIFETDDLQFDIPALNFRESAQTIQPPRTILIDIDGDEDAILARMNQGTRRKIRQSQKQSIRYYEGERDDVRKFTDMMHTTGTRNEFGVHEPAYYALAYDKFVPQHAALILAEHEGDALAGVMVFAVGKTAWYLYGASASIKRNLMASYGVQWAAIQWAKARGCTTYDMWGIPDADEAALETQFEQRSDGLWGVYGFKRGWGGRIVRSLSAWDYVYNPLLYAGYRQAASILRSG